MISLVVALQEPSIGHLMQVFQFWKDVQNHPMPIANHEVGYAVVQLMKARLGYPVPRLEFYSEYHSATWVRYHKESDTRCKNRSSSCVLS